MRPLCLLPAAGASSRMRGGDKLLELLGDTPCLAAMAQRAHAAGFDVLVTLPEIDHPRAQVLRGLPLKISIVPNPETGMSASIRQGADNALSLGVDLMILPPDMPAIDANDLRLVRETSVENPGKIVQGRTDDGRAGHPILFPNQILSEFSQLSGDRGAASIVKAHNADVLYVTLNGNRARLDLDTPEDWDVWRQSLLL